MSFPEVDCLTLRPGERARPPLFSAANHDDVSAHWIVAVTPDADVVASVPATATKAHIPTGTAWAVPHAAPSVELRNVSATAAATLFVIHQRRAAPGGAQWSFADARKPLSQYVQSLREQLADTLEVTGGLTEEEVAALHRVAALEEEARYDIATEEFFAVHNATFHQIVEMEAVGRLLLRNEKRDHMLVPWCNMGCRFCCMARQDWEGHVIAQYDLIHLALDDAEICVRSSVLSEEAVERGKLLWDWQVLLRLVGVQESARDALYENSLARRAGIVAEEVQCRQQMMLQLQADSQSFAASAEAAVLREKTLNVLRIQDSLSLQERRIVRQLHSQMEEEERIRRGQMQMLQDVRRVEIFNKRNAVLNAAMAAGWKAEIQDVIKERDELRGFQEAVLKMEEEKREEDERAVQQELEDELKEIKKLKKQGPPKNPPPPKCPRCGAVPAKDMHTHRVNECTERPTQCTKCELIMKLSSMEEHKTCCPSRVVQCATCANYYKAAYLQGQHATVCEEVLAARKTMSNARSRPTTGETDSPQKAIQRSPSGTKRSNPSSLQEQPMTPTDRLGLPALEPGSLTEAAAVLSTPPPATLADAERERLEALIAADEAHYCKPDKISDKKRKK